MIRLAVRAPAADADQVLAALLELAPSGVEQVDLEHEVEFAVYGVPGELPELAEGEAEVGGVRVVASGTFQVEGDRIRAYAQAVQEDNPVYHDADAAKEAGFRDLVAPPMFAVVYSAPAMGPAIVDTIGDGLPRMVHGGQEFVWGEPVCAGDTITSEASVKEIYEKDGKAFYV